MSQNGLIVIKDAASADVALTPSYKEGLLSVYNDRLKKAGLQTELSLGMRKPKSGQNDKVSLKLAFPYEVISGDATTIETVTAFVDFVFPETAPLATRQAIIAGVSSVVNDPIVFDLLENGGFPY